MCISNFSMCIHTNQMHLATSNQFAMPLLCLLIVAQLCSMPATTPVLAAATDTISAGHSLRGTDKLVSTNGRFALGFYQPPGSESSGLKNLNWYLGIWFNTVPTLTPVWVANGESPVTDPASSELRISDNGNLIILNQTGSVVWSSRANVTTNVHTIAVLLSSGNLVLRDASNSSHVLWESFDHPTDTLLPGGKVGRNKATGLNRRLVSRKNSIDPSPGVYSEELEPNDARQFVLAWSSSTMYWSSGDWKGNYFSAMPEMTTGSFFTSEFVSNDQEDYFTYSLKDDTLITRNIVDVTGQTKQLFWINGTQNWLSFYKQPQAQCDVYAVCGAFTVCDDTMFPTFCSCMKGFSVRSPRDWELDDRTGGCIRNTPLCCGGDKFYVMPDVRLPANTRGIEAGSSGECAQACLNNCSCTGYSFGSTGCSVWYAELLNVKQQYNGTSNRGILYLRLAASELKNSNKDRRGLTIGLVIGASLVVSGLLALIILLIWRRNRRELGGIEGGLLVLRYKDLQHATKNFCERIGGGSFGSVFKGLLRGSTAIAVKRLDGVRQGEKQFRAEVSSIGMVQHVNLVRLIGFCSEGTKRLLVYEHMPNRSLDTHLFHSNDAAAIILSWSTRYQIALGIARGLAYLHENCRDCIIHCDIKPQNILLDSSFVPKIADFGMAKIVGREFNRVLTTMRGTIGYLAPEWITGAAITTKVDVYSYGMVLFEIVSGRRNLSEENSSDATFFPVQMASKFVEGDVECLVEQKLYGGVNLEEVERVCKVAYWCIQDNELNRPMMREVVQILENLVEIKMSPIPKLLQVIAGI